MRRLLVLFASCLLCQPLMAQEAPLQVSGAITVNVMQAKHLHDHGALFIDVRPAREWGWGHVQGAVHLDLHGRFPGLAEASLPRETPLVIYCDSEVCAQSAVAVEQAVRQLFSPDKINLASFGNMVPHVHWHIIPRWRDDRHFPEPIWGRVQRTDSPLRPKVSDTVLISVLADLLQQPEV